MSCPECRSGHCHRLQVQYKDKVRRLEVQIKEDKLFIAMLERQIAQMVGEACCGRQG